MYVYYEFSSEKPDSRSKSIINRMLLSTFQLDDLEPENLSVCNIAKTAACRNHQPCSLRQAGNVVTDVVFITSSGIMP